MTQMPPPPGRAGAYDARLGYSGYRPPQNNGHAIASMVLGIVGMMSIPLILSILALVFGYKARREIAASDGREGGGGYATAGIVLGWIGVVLAVIWVPLMISFFARFFEAIPNGGPPRF